MDNAQQPEPQKEASEIQVEEANQPAPESFETLNGSEESKLQADLKAAQNELAEAKDKYLRMYSEFENFRRRTAKEKLELIQSASEQVVKMLLPVMDDFERAEKAFQNTDSKELEGFLLIYNKFKKVLEQAGVKPMEVASGSDFNADVQEAITQIPAPDEKLKGKVVDVVEKGYLLNDKVIRFAKVVVGN
jgi:molecular chaperone GrpE